MLLECNRSNQHSKLTGSWLEIWIDVLPNGNTSD